MDVKHSDAKSKSSKGTKGFGGKGYDQGKGGQHQFQQPPAYGYGPVAQGYAPYGYGKQAPCGNRCMRECGVALAERSLFY